MEIHLSALHLTNTILSCFENAKLADHCTPSSSGQDYALTYGKEIIFSKLCPSLLKF